VRLQRTKQHRDLKSATFPFEKEKFSYVIMTKEPLNKHEARILTEPMRRSGHMLLKLCTEDGLKNTTLYKKHKELYKKARKAKWGDLLNDQSTTTY